MRALALLAVLVLGSCQPVAPPVGDIGLTGPERMAVELQACEERGGSFQRAGKGGVFTCVTRTRDAGKSCTAATQCESLCLARSRTCAPVKPIFGCNDILNSAGVRLTQCID
jgi:hypothetical protein